MININNLKLYVLYILDEEVTITHTFDNIPDFQLPLLQDSILETKVWNTRKNTYTSFLIGHKGKTPANAKWMTPEMMQINLPHLWLEVWDASELKQRGIGPPYSPRGLGASPKEPWHYLVN